MLSAQMVLSWPNSNLRGREIMAIPKFAIFSVAASLFCKGAAQTCHQSTVAVNLSDNKQNKTNKNKVRQPVQPFCSSLFAIIFTWMLIYVT